VFGLASPRDPPDIEKLEDAGLMEKPTIEIDLDGVLGISDEDAVELAEEFEHD
jgi:segregation and condensation protein B